MTVFAGSTGIIAADYLNWFLPVFIVSFVYWVKHR